MLYINCKCCTQQWQYTSIMMGDLNQVNGWCKQVNGWFKHNIEHFIRLCIDQGTWWAALPMWAGSNCWWERKLPLLCQTGSFFLLILRSFCNTPYMGMWKFHDLSGLFTGLSRTWREMLRCCNSSKFACVKYCCTISLFLLSPSWTSQCLMGAGALFSTATYKSRTDSRPRGVHANLRWSAVIIQSTWFSWLPLLLPALDWE